VTCLIRGWRICGVSATQTEPRWTEGLALYFPAPASFTGEHVLECKVTAAAFIVDRVLRRVLGMGVRMARPGEFSERAFLNGKMDLAQAEAVADLIDAGTTAARARGDALDAGRILRAHSRTSIATHGTAGVRGSGHRFSG